MASRLKPVVAVLALVGVGGASWLQVHRVRAARSRVWTEAVRERDVQATITATGLACWAGQTTLSAPDSGRVRSVLVKVGQTVRGGQALAVLDDLSARLALGLARSTVAAAAADVEHAHADVDRLRAEREQARSSLFRTAELFAAGTASAEGVAGSRHDARQAELALASGIASVEAARARLRRAEADVLDAESRVSQYTIRAPADGVVIELAAQPGQPVHAGHTHVPPSRLLTLGLSAVTDVEVPLDIRGAARLRAGARASVAIPALGEDELEARVLAVDDGGGGQQAVVRARLSAPPRGLRQGMSAIVHFTATSRTRTLAVPNHAVAGRDGVRAAGAGVWTVRDGIIALTPIVLGLRGDSYSQVLAGLTPGTLVVTGPAAVIRTLGVGDKAVAVRAPIQTP